jgi:hypothetical protein
VRKLNLTVFSILLLVASFSGLIAQIPKNFKPFPYVKSDGRLKAKLQNRLKIELDTVRYYIEKLEIEE